MGWKFLSDFKVYFHVLDTFHTCFPSAFKEAMSAFKLDKVNLSFAINFVLLDIFVEHEKERQDSTSKY